MSTPSPAVQKLLDQNATYTSTFTPLLNMKQYSALLAANPSLPRVCIIACPDPRVIPEHIFGLAAGDALVIRVAGGNIQPALASLLAIDSLVTFTDVMVMRHTDCGTELWTDDKIRDMLMERSAGKKRVEGRAGEKVEHMVFCESVGNTEDLLRGDVEWLRNSPLIREEMKKAIVGMVFHLDTGEVKVVC